MNKESRKTDPQRPPLRDLFDKILSAMEREIETLPETLQGVSPEKRLDFLSKTLPLLLKYRISGEGNTWGGFWGD